MLGSERRLVTNRKQDVAVYLLPSGRHFQVEAEMQDEVHHMRIRRDGQSSVSQNQRGGAGNAGGTGTPSARKPVNWQNLCCRTKRRFRNPVESGRQERHLPPAQRPVPHRTHHVDPGSVPRFPRGVDRHVSGYYGGTAIQDLDFRPSRFEEQLLAICRRFAVHAARGRSPMAQGCGKVACRRAPHSGIAAKAPGNPSWSVAAAVTGLHRVGWQAPKAPPRREDRVARSSKGRPN